MFAKKCAYDSMNFQHMCKIIGRPCAYIDKINDCPYLAEAEGKKILKKDEQIEKTA